MQLPSKLVENAVEEFAKLPGIGKKTALRLVLHLLKEENRATQQLAETLVKMREGIQYCQTCFNISDEPQCQICKDHNRDQSLLCVVENISDVLAIENTAQYRGSYHVLGGVISPLDGIGPTDIRIKELMERLYADSCEVKEVILALNATMEADTTAFYLTKKIKSLEKEFHISTIARGIPVGSELEYTDEVTLGRSIVSRVSYK